MNVTTNSRPTKTKTKGKYRTRALVLFHSFLPTVTVVRAAASPTAARHVVVVIIITAALFRHLRENGVNPE